MHVAPVRPPFHFWFISGGAIGLTARSGSHFYGSVFMVECPLSIKPPLPSNLFLRARYGVRSIDDAHISMLTCDKGLSFRAWLNGSWAWSPSSIGSRTTTPGGAAASFGHATAVRAPGCLRFAPVKPMRICSAVVQRAKCLEINATCFHHRRRHLNIKSNKGCLYIRRIYAAHLCSMVPDPCRRTLLGVVWQLESPSQPSTRIESLVAIPSVSNLNFNFHQRDRSGDRRGGRRYPPPSQPWRATGARASPNRQPR